MKSFPLLAIVLALTALTCSCSKDNSTPTTPSSAPTTELFVGTLAKGATSFYSFTAESTGTSSLTLVSLGSPTAVPRPSVELGFGVPAGTGCGVTNVVQASPGLVAQLTNANSTSIYCANIRDTGGLSGSSAFVVRIVHP